MLLKNAPCKLCCIRKCLAEISKRLPLGKIFTRSLPVFSSRAIPSQRLEVPNTKGAMARLVQGLDGRPFKVQVICEASGGYEQTLMRALHRSGLAVTLVQPNRVRQFARAERHFGQDRPH